MTSSLPFNKASGAAVGDDHWDDFSVVAKGVKGRIKYDYLKETENDATLAGYEGEDGDDDSDEEKLRKQTLKQQLLTNTLNSMSFQTVQTNALNFLSQDIADLTKEIDGYTKIIEKLDQEAQTIKQNIATREAEQQVIEQKLETNAAETKTLETEKTAAQAELVVAKQDVSDLKQDVQQAAEVVVQATEQKQEQQVAVQEAVAVLEDKKADLQEARQDQMTVTVDGKQYDVYENADGEYVYKDEAGQEQDISLYQKAMLLAEDTLGGNTANEKDAAQQEVQAQSAALRDEREKLEAAQEQVAQAKQDQAKIQNELTFAEKRVGHITDRITAIDEKLGSLNTEREQLLAKYKNNESMNAQDRARLEKIDASKAEYEELKERREAQLEKTKEVQSNLQNGKYATKEEINAAMTDLGGERWTRYNAAHPGPAQTATADNTSRTATSQAGTDGQGIQTLTDLTSTYANAKLPRDIPLDVKQPTTAPVSEPVPYQQNNSISANGATL